MTSQTTNGFTPTVDFMEPTSRTEALTVIHATRFGYEVRNSSGRLVATINDICDHAGRYIVTGYVRLPSGTHTYDLGAFDFIHDVVEAVADFRSSL
jgi:hypothetical protein